MSELLQQVLSVDHQSSCAMWKALNMDFAAGGCYHAYLSAQEVE